VGSCQKQHFVTDPYPVTDSDRVRQVKQTTYIELAMLTDLETLPDRKLRCFNPLPADRGAEGTA